MKQVLAFQLLAVCIFLFSACETTTDSERITIEDVEEDLKESGEGKGYASDDDKIQGEDIGTADPEGSSVSVSSRAEGTIIGSEDSPQDMLDQDGPDDLGDAAGDEAGDVVEERIKGISIEPEPVLVEMIDKRFLPDELNIERGTTILFRHSEDFSSNIIHSLVIRPIAQRSGRMMIEDEFSYRFDEPGEYTVIDQLLPEAMILTISVD